MFRTLLRNIQFCGDKRIFFTPHFKRTIYFKGKISWEFLFSVTKYIQYHPNIWHGGPLHRLCGHAKYKYYILSIMDHLYYDIVKVTFVNIFHMFSINLPGKCMKVDVSNIPYLPGYVRFHSFRAKAFPSLGSPPSATVSLRISPYTRNES